MRTARLDQSSPKEAVTDTPGEVLVDLGIALVAFGTALQLAGKRLQTNQLQPIAPPQLLAPPTVPAISGLPAEGYLRIWDIIGRKSAKGRPATLGVIPLGSATWYAGVKSGRFPKPIKHGRIAMWRVEDIRALVAQLGR